MLACSCCSLISSDLCKGKRKREEMIWNRRKKRERGRDKKEKRAKREGWGARERKEVSHSYEHFQWKKVVLHVPLLFPPFSPVQLIRSCLHRAAAAPLLVAVLLLGVAASVRVRFFLVVAVDMASEMKLLFFSNSYIDFLFIAHWPPRSFFSAAPPLCSFSRPSCEHRALKR